MLTCSEPYLEQFVVYSYEEHCQYNDPFKICETVITVLPADALWVAFVSDTVSGIPSSGSLGLQGSYHLVRECDDW